MTIDWKALAADVIAYRDAKGFAPTLWSDLPTRICCIHSECRELEDALENLSHASWRSRLTCERAVRLECADVAMYSLTVLWDLGTPTWDFRRSYHGGARRYASPAEMTRPVRKYADDAFRAWRRGDRKDARVSTELVLAALVDMKGRVLGHASTVMDDVREKIAASANRPRAHGKDPRS